MLHILCTYPSTFYCVFHIVSYVDWIGSLTQYEHMLWQKFSFFMGKYMGKGVNLETVAHF